MMTTPRSVIDSVLRSVCGRAVERLVPLTGGGMNETYRAELLDGVAVIARIALQPEPWFVDEADLMAQARDLGVPTPEVLGVVHLEYDAELLSFSIQQYLPGRSLDQLVGELPYSDLERLVVDGGELLARIHSAVADRGVRHQLRLPEDTAVARVVRIVGEAPRLRPRPSAPRSADLLRTSSTRADTYGMPDRSAASRHRAGHSVPTTPQGSARGACHRRILDRATYCLRKNLFGCPADRG